MNALACLLNVLHSRGDVPPIENAGDWFANDSANKTEKRGFAVAEDGDGAAG